MKLKHCFMERHQQPEIMVMKVTFISSPVQSTGRAIVVTLASALALALPLALPFPSRHF